MTKGEQIFIKLTSIFNIMISIIGGGPAGAYTAYLLSKEGYDVDIYEEHSNIGNPIRCTGIVTSTIKDILPLKQNFIVNKIQKIRINSLNQQSTEIKLKEPDLILDRSKFDQYLINKAIDQGAGLFLNHRLTGLENRKLKFSINGKTNYTEKNKYIVGADGPLSVVGKSMNSTIKNFFIGSQVVIEDNFDKDTVDTFIFKQGFGWIVPESETIARVGILGYKNSGTKLNQLLKTKFNNPKILQRQGGLIPVYNPKLKTYENNKYLIGDAAGMVKATTGGGIVQSLIAAKQLTKSIKTKQNYETLWKQKLNKSLKLHLWTRKILDRFEDSSIDKMIKLANQDKVQKVLSNHNRDQPTKLLFNILRKEPRYLLFLKNLL